MTEVLVQGTKAFKRRSTLEPYLLKIQDVLLREPFDPNRSRKMSIAGVAISLEPWVVLCVEPRVDPPDDNTERAELVRQSLSLWLKSAMDVRSLRREIQNGASNLYAEQAKLMQDSSLGATLLLELQRCSDGFVLRGDLEEAKRLSKFRGQVSALVRELKQVISESNAYASIETEEPIAEIVEPVGEVVAEPAPAPVPAPTSATVARSVPREPVPETRRPVRRPRPAPETFRTAEPVAKPTSYRTQILVGLNIIAIVAAIRLRAPAQMHGKTPSALAAHDFEHATALVEVVARPPALYASVDQKIWSSYNRDQRREFVDSMGSVLSSKGYWGLTLKTSDGRVVGEWLEKGGTKLIEIVPDGGTKPGKEVGQFSRFVP